MDLLTGKMLKFSIFVVVIFNCTIRGLHIEASRWRRGATSNEVNNTNGNSKLLFSIDEALSGEYRRAHFNGTWISETEFIYNIGDKIFKFDTSNRRSHLLLRDGIIAQSIDFELSPDQDYLLVRTEQKQIFRHTFVSKYFIHNMRTGVTEPLANQQFLSYAMWSPKSPALVYVLDNDIYYHKLCRGKPGDTRRLTFDGKPGIIYNGRPDWVYEEEVLENDKAAWISPSGNYLAFATFNDTNVREMSLFTYGVPWDRRFQYPKEQKIRYPKAGTPNPTVTLNLIDLADHGKPLVTLAAPIDAVGNDHILFAVKWFERDTLVVTWTNRVQNIAQIVTYSTTGMWHPILYQELTNGWLISPGRSPILRDRYLILIKPQPAENPSLGSLEHLTRFDLLNGILDRELDLSPGNMTVHNIYGINELKGLIFFSACPINDPSQKHIYSVSLQSNKSATPKCLTCDHVTPEGNKCEYAQAYFSTDLSHYAMFCSGPDLPTINIFDLDNKAIFNWNNNDYLREKYAHRYFPKQKDFYVEANGYRHKVRLLLPHDFTPMKKYPMILKVYAGPGSQIITDSFSVGYEHYMTTNKQVIYALIDGRGSDNRGSATLYQVYRDLGNVEIEDQIGVTEKLQQMFSWIDANRTGVWGWSYGGYATAMILARDTHDVFKCGVSVAPVTTWLYYDSIYTERYMGLPTPEDNLRNYEKSDVTRQVRNLSNKKFMLVHGTDDDNVHFQQSLALARALTDEDVLFQQVTYPDEAHGLVHVQKHLYHTLTNFWDKCFDLH